MRFAPLCALLLLQACDKPYCKATPEVFDTEQPNTKAYNKALVQELKTNAANKLRYWIDGYRVEGTDTFMLLEVQGKALCAKLWLDIANVNDIRLANFKRVEGRSYIGARLIDLHYDIVQVHDSYAFRYNSLKAILD